MDTINTENRNPASKDVDLLSTEEILRRINAEDKTVAYQVEKEIETIAKAADTMTDALENGNKVFYIGSGTSGRLGVLDASECPPTYGVPDDLFIGVIAGGDRALRYSIEGAEDVEEDGKTDLQDKGFQKGDVLVGIAASGSTPYVKGALKYAREVGSPTISISCVKDSEIGRLADTAIEIETGAEIVTGSTRMKAGTAQKMVLNMLSTTTMIKRGKVYNGLMVDVTPVNKKLVSRSKRIIAEITDVDEKEAERLLKESGMNVKVAILLGLTDLKKEEILSELKRKNGSVSKVIREEKKQEER